MQPPTVLEAVAAMKLWQSFRSAGSWIVPSAGWPSRVVNRYRSWRYGEIDIHARLGVRGEQAAARLLRQRGYAILAQSESDRGGEIDLIATDPKHQTIVFVEVKTLASTKPGHPADRVDEDKQARVTRAALRYLRRNQLLSCRCRFDVIAVWWPEGHDAPTRLEHYPHAFDATGVDGFYS